jgi:predicted RNA-binding Zn-ribbon protein involved in translation (DUF1610 family)
MTMVGLALIIALALVYAIAAGVHYSRKRCPHCGAAGVTPHFDHDGRSTSTSVTCDHCGKEV